MGGQGYGQSQGMSVSMGGPGTGVSSESLMHVDDVDLSTEEQHTSIALACGLPPIPPGGVSVSV